MTSLQRRGARPGYPPASFVIWTFVLGVISTGVHYTHNFVYASDYPPVPIFGSDLAYQIGIVAFWPTLTVYGAWGVRQYARGRRLSALIPLAAWSGLGTTSPGHFIGGIPDIPAYAMFTISTDFATGVVMLVLVGMALQETVRSRRQQRASGPAREGGHQ